MRGRRASVAGAVAALDAPRPTRERLGVLLETLTGQRSVADAGARLGMGRTRVLALRRQALQGAVDALAPGSVGRPRTTLPAEAPEVARLQARVRDLELALQAALVRTEVALTMPFLLTRGAGGKKGPGRPPRAHPPGARAARQRGGDR